MRRGHVRSGGEGEEMRRGGREEGCEMRVR